MPDEVGLGRTDHLPAGAALLPRRHRDRLAARAARRPGPRRGASRTPPPPPCCPRGADRWTRALDSLVARHDLTVGFAALALLIAVVLGAMHALAPGHGKTLMAAVAAARGGKARMKDVLPLAASVTVTHTLGVVALGLLVTAGSAAAPSVIAWLGIASGVLVTAAGVTLLRRALRTRAHAARARTRSRGRGATRSAPWSWSPPTRRPPRPRQAPTAGRTHHGHGHTHDHPHGHGHTHDHDHPHDHPHPHTHAVEHTHGGFTHTHAIAPTLRGTILLGFAGGLVPSPSAVVVLVGAAALGQAWFGLLLVVAYGVGLALTLTAAGFAVVRLGSGVTRLLDRRPRLAGQPDDRPGAQDRAPDVGVRRGGPRGGLVLKGAASALG